MNTTRLQQLNKLLKKQPDEPFLWHAKGVEFSKAGEWQQAHDCFAKAIELDENHVGSYYHLGRAYESLQQYENARKTYQKGIQIATKVGDYHARGELQTVLTLVEEDLDE